MFRSTCEKVSYHIIQVDPAIIFENNQTLGIFVRTMMFHLLNLVLRHKCSHFSMEFQDQNCSLAKLITILSPYVRQMRVQCIKCIIISNCIYASDIAHLMVLNKAEKWTLAIDTSVYSKNQQFRLFQCIKSGQDNPLVETGDFPIRINRIHSFHDILRNSLITSIVTCTERVLIQYQNDNFIINTNAQLRDRISLKEIIFILNKEKNNLKYSLSSTSAVSLSTNEVVLLRHAHASETSDLVTDFVINLITSDSNHHGYIRSQLLGSRNPNIIIYNIGGGYRFCPRKGTHHLHNTVAILINMMNNEFAIRCKDPECDNSTLSWNKIE